MPNAQQKAYEIALDYYVAQGISEALGDSPVNRFVQVETTERPDAGNVSGEREAAAGVEAGETSVFLGKSEAQAEALRLALAASTLEELKQAIAEFEGVSLKKTATNLVFSAGNPEASVMLVGDAPGADEDREGFPFAGESGALLDKILGSVGLDRSAEDVSRAVYLSNVLNWRPPGNRTPAPAEIEVSLPFIERHIQLVAPKILIFCGSVSAKALLGSGESISRLRGKGWHDYSPRTPELRKEALPAISTLVTYHPSYLLKTPGQKRAVWNDMLALDKKRGEMSLKERS